MKYHWSIITALATLLAPAAAMASSGVLTGTLYFWNKNGNYCPSTETCTGANYKESKYDTIVGIPEAKLQVIRASDNVVIGTTTLTTTGGYTVSWSSAGTGNVTAYLRLIYEHKDGVFRMKTTSGSVYANLSANFTLTNATTAGSPQSFSWQWGTSASPITYANAYWAGWMTYQLLDNSNRMVNNFTDVDVYGFDNSAPCSGTSCADCGTSCARGQYENAGANPAWAQQKKTVVLDANAAYKPAERMMHEFGHIADYAARKYRFGTGYGYDGDTGWSSTSLEWRPSALHEGYATFVSMVSLYDDIATEPRTCLSSSHCYTSGHDVEESHQGSCTTEEGRMAISATRFFWDIIDTPNDGSDSLDHSFYVFPDSVAAWPCPNYPACYADGELHDQFSSVSSNLASTTVSPGEEDEGNAWDYRNNMLNNYSGAVDVQDQYFNNCMNVF
ncbi:hypothetical protein [Polyangium aurulentum]|uniref:hypothetical protein n=1 Tax=Polyangium aurulentum TaxID=2567896 RepID=UPI0010AE6AE3|nr:hypothetical protein [Polyangium aurulentum]UQA56925.1 hypothetical protein E8A73_037375 [Polyangium aurulentum]